MESSIFDMGLSLGFAAMAVLVTATVWVALRSRRASPPIKPVDVEVPLRWYRLVQRPVVFWSTIALGGVSITFAPLALYGLGRSGVADWRVAICFGVVYLVPLVFIKLGMPVVQHAYRHRR